MRVMETEIWLKMKSDKTSYKDRIRDCLSRLRNSKKYNKVRLARFTGWRIINGKRYYTAIVSIVTREGTRISAYAMALRTSHDVVFVPFSKKRSWRLRAYGR